MFYVEVLKNRYNNVGWTFCDAIINDIGIDMADDIILVGLWFVHRSPRAMLIVDISTGLSIFTTPISVRGAFWISRDPCYHGNS